MQKAKLLIISCIDFRFQDYVFNWLKDNQYLGHCDLYSIAGCSRDLVKPLDATHKENFLRNVGISVKLHDPDEIIILDHQDCGGYAQDDTIPSMLEKEKDIDRHKEFAQKARTILSEIYPSLEIKTMYIGLDGEVQDLS